MALTLITLQNTHLVVIGKYATMCCHLDLFEIDSQERIDDVLQEYKEAIEYGEDSVDFPYEIFDSREEALEYFTGDPNFWEEGMYLKKIQ